MSLSPREHITVIRSVLGRERAMRERGVPGKPTQTAQQGCRVDRALESLAALEHLAAQREAPQGNLFGEGT